MNPNSRPPWALWFRFMKSMSIPDQGISRLNWVCRWANGFRRAESPPIHIFAGEKVCIQVTRPMQRSAEFASSQSVRIASGVVRTGRQTTRTGRAGAESSPVAMRFASSATFRRISSP